MITVFSLPHHSPEMTVFFHDVPEGDLFHALQWKASFFFPTLFSG